jgi:hypothetical protein
MGATLKNLAEGQEPSRRRCRKHRLGLATPPLGQIHRVPLGCGAFGHSVRQAGSPMRRGIAFAALPAELAEFDQQRARCQLSNRL